MRDARATAVLRTVVAAVVAWVAFGPVGAGAAALLCGTWPRLARNVRDRRTVQALPSQFATLFEVAARGVRSGAAIDVALDDAASLQGGLAGDLVVELVWMARAESFPVAVARWQRRHRDPSVSVAGSVIALSTSGLGEGARALQAAATILRERDAAAREVAAWAAQARASAALLVAAPVVLGAAGTVADPTMLRHLLRDPLVGISLAAGLVLDGIGAWWMARVVGSLGAAR